MGQSHAVDVHGKSSSARTPPRSGTSFSAVVVASALAASWHRDQNLSAEEVFDAVYAEATQSPNDPTVSTHYRPSPNTAVTVSMCASGQASCCAQQRAPRAGFPDLPALPTLATLTEGAKTESPTPYGAWVLPQPRDNGCSYCVVDPATGSLYLDLEREWTRGTLELTLASGGGVQSYPIPGPLPAGPQTYRLTAGLDATKALIRLEREQTGFTIGTVIDLAVK